MVDSERHQQRDVAGKPGRCPMDMVEVGVLPERIFLAAMLQEILQLGEGRDFRRAQQARDRKGAAGIGPGRRGLMLLTAQPAAQEAGHEAVAGAERIIDLDREALPHDALFQIVRDFAIIDDAAHGAALQNDGGGR